MDISQYIAEMDLEEKMFAEPDWNLVSEEDKEKICKMILNMKQVRNISVQTRSGDRPKLLFGRR